MISVLAQERLLGAALGGAFSGFVVFQQRKEIYQKISQHEDKQPASQFKVRDYVPQGKSQTAHLWNRAVDKIFGPVIASLSSRGW